MEGLELLPWPVQLGVIGFLILVIVTLVVRRERAISRGDLVPKETHEREMKAERTRGDEMRDLWKISDRRADVMESVAGDIVVIGENLDKLLQALPVSREEGDPS